MTSVGGGLRFVLVCTARRAAAAMLFVIAFTILFAAGVRAQESSVDAKRGAPVSKLELSKSIVDFAQPGQDFLAGSATGKKSFTIKDNGSYPLSVNVEPPSGSKCFTIWSGQGTTLIQPHGESTVTVEFAPTDQGNFSASIACCSKVIGPMTPTLPARAPRFSNTAIAAPMDEPPPHATSARSAIRRAIGA